MGLYSQHFWQRKLEVAQSYSNSEHGIRNADLVLQITLFAIIKHYNLYVGYMNCIKKTNFI